MTYFSPLATQVKRPRDVEGSREKIDGIVLHTTGRTFYEKTGRDSDAALSATINYYCTPGQPFPCYLIGHEGEIVQIASEQEKSWHAAWDKAQVAEYKSWLTKTIPQQFAWWDKRWYTITPMGTIALATRDRSWGPDDNRTESPNDDYCGIELLWHPGHITDKQYLSCAQLCIDIAKRHQFDLEMPPNPRLLGHEDLCPTTRTTDSGKPWDPGTQLDWDHLWEVIGDVAHKGGKPLGV